MSFDPALFRRRVGLWLPALLFFLATLVALVLYPVRFAGRTEVTEEELATARAALETFEARTDRVEARVEALTTTRTALERLYGQQFTPESVRLTRLIAEVKDLASRSGLLPEQISYPTQPLEGFGLRRRSFVFSVNGTYDDLRKFINLLELTDSFLTLEQVSLSDSQGGRLSIRLRLSTLFSVDGAEPLEGLREGGRS